VLAILPAGEHSASLGQAVPVERGGK